MKKLVAALAILAVLSLTACKENTKNPAEGATLNTSGSVSAGETSSSATELSSASSDESSAVTSEDSASAENSPVNNDPHINCPVPNISSRPSHHDDNHDNHHDNQYYDDYTSQSGDFTVEFDVEDNETEIKRYNGTGGNVTIPAQINGYRVTEIDSRAFENCTGLTGVTIPSSVESIGEDAFANCTSLSSVTIENGVREIDEYAFSGCTALNRLDLPDSVREIERFAFSGCTNLTVSYRGVSYAGEDIFRLYND